MWFYRLRRSIRTNMRFFLLFWTLLCLTSIWSNILAFNFSLLCFEAQNSPGNSSDSFTTVQPLFSPCKTTMLTSAMALAAFISNIVVVPLMATFGSRITFTAFGLLTAASTALMPFALAAENFAGLLVLRIFQGIAFAVNYPMIGVFASRWTVEEQTGMFVSTLVAFYQLAPTFTNSASGPLCASHLGWPAVLYGHATVTAFFFIAFFIIYRDYPEQQPLVTTAECLKLSRNNALQPSLSKRFVPYLAIFKTKAVWGVLIASMGNSFVISTVFLYSPKFFTIVLKLEVAKAGILSALPPLIEFFIKLAAGSLSDKLPCFSQRNALRFFNSSAFFTSAVFFLVLTLIPVDHPAVPFVFLSAATGALGMATGGFFKCVPLVCKQYSQFVMGTVSQTLTFCLIIVPFVMQLLAPRDSSYEWRLVFWLMATVLVASNVAFVILCDAKPAFWTTDAFAAKYEAKAKQHIPPQKPPRGIKSSELPARSTNPFDEDQQPSTSRGPNGVTTVMSIGLV